MLTKSHFHDLGCSLEAHLYDHIKLCTLLNFLVCGAHNWRHTGQRMQVSLSFSPRCSACTLVYSAYPAHSGQMSAVQRCRAHRTEASTTCAAVQHFVPFGIPLDPSANTQDVISSYRPCKQHASTLCWTVTHGS